MRRGILAALLVLLPAAGWSQPLGPIGIWHSGGGGITGLTSNGSVITSTLPLTLPAGSAAAPSLTFTGSDGFGLTMTSASIIGMYVGSSIRIMDWRATGIYIPSNTTPLWLGAGPGTGLVSPASHILALRNATDLQTFYVHRTWTSDTNFAALAITGNEIKPASAGATAGSAGLYSIQGSYSKTLTDAAAAASFTRIAVTSNSYEGGELLWVATSTDATDYRALTGRTRFSAVNKAGAETCDIAAAGTDLLESSNGNALACTWTCANVAADTIDLQVTCTDNTAGDQTIAMRGRLDLPIPATVTPQ